jgi:aryl-alcohol dehydrogenase-like predicted oxidoreductase
MASRGNRDEMVLATKYSSPYMLAEKGKIQSNYGGNGIKSLRLSVDASLRKLQTSYIDLLYVHWWDYAVTIPELMHSLNDLVVSGKVMFLGISDTPAWVVTKANQYAYSRITFFSFGCLTNSCTFKAFTPNILQLDKVNADSEIVQVRS